MMAQRQGSYRRLAFALTMLAFGCWLHATLTVLAWLSHRQASAPSPLFAVAVVGVLVVALRCRHSLGGQPSG